MIEVTPKLTTTVYRYKRYGTWMLIGYAVSTVLLFVMSGLLPPLATGVLVLLFVSVPVYAAWKTSSFFSIRAVDDRELTLSPDEVKWGTWLIPITDVSELEIEIYSVDSLPGSRFPRTRQRRVSTQYGDNNQLQFIYRKVSYKFTFYLGSLQHYAVLLQIIKSWREKGISCKAQSALNVDTDQADQ